jgi:arsenite methyltransferase
MPDVYAMINEVDEAVIERVAMAMDSSAADPQHREIVHRYLGDISLTGEERVIEIGCGTGAIGRLMAGAIAFGEYVGTDPSPALIERARAHPDNVAAMRFECADGGEQPFADDEFDVAVLHRVLSHVPDQESVVREAVRLLKPGGWLAVCDGDYSTTTLALGRADPLECCVEAFLQSFVNDAWVVRRLGLLAAEAGIIDTVQLSHGFVQVRDADYMLSIVARGADALLGAGLVGPELAESLKAEAERRVEHGTFFGHVAYGSLVGRKPQP